MNLIEMLDKLRGTLLSVQTAEDIKLKADENEKEDLEVEIKDEVIVNEVDETKEEDLIEEPTIQSLQEEIISLSEELASLMQRVSELESPSEEEIKETETELELKKAKAELAKLKEPATEPIISNSKTEMASSFALKMKATINKQRIKAGYNEI